MYKRRQRSLANAYVLEWLAGTPDFTLDIESKIIPDLNEHPELLYSLMHGMALYKMEHPEVNDTVKLHTEGLVVVAELASQSKELSKSRELKKLIRMNSRHKLKAHVKEVLSGNDKS